MTYIMDSPLEGQRIELKTDRGLTIEQLRWLGVGDSARLLDVGCAGGTTCRIASALVGPRGIVTGVDISEARVAEARGHSTDSPNACYCIGDACRLPFGSGSFDFTWSRFLMEYLSDPLSAIREMARVTRDDGWVGVSDLDGNCVWHSPISGELADEIEAAVQTLGRSFDPYIGRRLYGICCEAGLADVSVDVRPYHIIAGRVNERQEQAWRLKLEGVYAALVNRGWQSDRSRRLVDLMLAHLLDPTTFTYSVLISVKGRKTSARHLNTAAPPD